MGTVDSGQWSVVSGQRKAKVLCGLKSKRPLREGWGWAGIKDNSPDPTSGTWGIEIASGLDLGFEVADDAEEALVEATVAGDGFLYGDVGDVEAFEDGDAAPLLFV